MQYFFLVEWAATFVESLILLCTITAASGRRYEKSRHYLAMLLSTVCLTVLINVLNAVSIFSFLTPVISMCFVIFILSRITSTGSLLIRSTACIMTYLVIITVGYVIFVLIRVVYAGDIYSAFTFFMSPGPFRVVFLTVDKIIDVLFYFFVHKSLFKISTLKKKYQMVVLLISLAAYISTQYLFGVFLDTANDALSAVAIFSWLYILAFVTITIIAFVLIARAEQERQTHIFLHSANQLLTENYQQLHAYQQDHAKQIHDFNHHLTALKGLAALGKREEALAYMESLLSTTYRETALCHSGSDIIDAIINFKAAEATQLGIDFRFAVSFPVSADIAPVDICGVLANQIDNAFDACRQMPPSYLREVKITIKHVENFVFFRVENTVDHDPFENNSSLSSTKTDTSAQHGLGLKNIHDITDKYSGFLRNEYKSGLFISVASFCYETLDT